MTAIDTIVALSTPPGRSGIGVIRLSGARSVEFTSRLLDDPSFDPEPNRVSLKTLRDPACGGILDRALVTYFKAPHSFTGEDVVELSCHGSPPLLLRLIDILLEAGARAADPGEYTLRSLSHGRLNLSQAEAVRDLIDAQTHAGVRLAARQLGGELSARLQPIRDALLEIIVPLESALEFVEDDLPADINAGVRRNLSALIARLDYFADTFRAGRLLKEGLKVTLAGRPNVGKSSVFNSLVAHDRAIVTDFPGTTRDSLSEVINLGGIPILLTDTAGLRPSADPIERLGIERTRRAIVEADLIVLVLDGSQPPAPEDGEILAEVSEKRYIIALNKSDLGAFNGENVPNSANGASIVTVSAKDGSGLDELRSAILEPFVARETSGADFLITNARHYDLLRRSADSLRSTEALLANRASEELQLVGLYDALRYLGEITGETTSEEVLTQIFASFCIGK